LNPIQADIPAMSLKKFTAIESSTRASDKIFLQGLSPAPGKARSMEPGDT
jgi:hypothetical protein